MSLEFKSIISLADSLPMRPLIIVLSRVAILPTLINDNFRSPLSPFGINTISVGYSHSVCEVIKHTVTS